MNVYIYLYLLSNSLESDWYKWSWCYCGDIVFYSVYVIASFKSVEDTRDQNSQLPLAVTVCELSIVLYSKQTVKCTSMICNQYF